MNIKAHQAIGQSCEFHIPTSKLLVLVKSDLILKFSRTDSKQVNSSGTCMRVVLKKKIERGDQTCMWRHQTFSSARPVLKHVLFESAKPHEPRSNWLLKETKQFASLKRRACKSTHLLSSRTKPWPAPLLARRCHTARAAAKASGWLLSRQSHVRLISSQRSLTSHGTLYSCVHLDGWYEE